MIEIREDPYNLAPLWRAILDVYTAFADLCERHGLRHYIGFGSAIGVVRHQGFVPWDDDLDVMMPRPDYEKFKEICKSELPDHLRFVDLFNTPEFMQQFGKLMNVRRDVVEKLEERLGRALQQGVFIDIMPIDGYPSHGISLFVRRLSDRVLIFKKKLLYHKTRKDGLLKYVAATILWYSLFWLYPQLRNDRDFVVFQNKRIRKFVFGATDKCVPVTSAMSVCRTGQVNDFKDFSAAVMKEMCGMEVPLAVGYDAILRARYGDYMTLPPEEKRKPTHYEQRVAPWKFGPTAD